MTIRIALCVAYCVLILVGVQSQVPITNARNMAIGAAVTVSGVVLNGEELGIIRYVHDQTAAIAAYPGNGSIAGFEETVKRGDQIQVTGILSDFNGLLEISPITGFEVISSDNPLPDPVFVDIGALDESLEAQLVKTFSIQFELGGDVFEDNRSYGVYSSGGNGEIYIRRDHPLVGTQIPMERVNVTGIASQFFDYQLLPRDANDLEVASDFFVIEEPRQSDLTQTSFALDWSTSLPASAVISVWNESGFDQEFVIDQLDLDHAMTVDNLTPSTFYQVQLAAIQGTDTIRTIPKLMSTGSNSTGEIEVYFTGEIDDTYSNGSQPTAIGGNEVIQALIEKIDHAQSTIDFCAYNIDQVEIIQALEYAHMRGVRVRYVHNVGTSNTALEPIPSFPLLGVNEFDLMHNKFVIIDAESQNGAWVTSGSMNFTQRNIFNDYNNVVMIQDNSLAKAYTIEFEELWGSTSSIPDSLASRSSSEKSDNTPHLFLVGGKYIESYFSPSDQTSNAIEAALRTADDNVLFALFSFTFDDITDEIIINHQAGKDVRGIIENVNDQSGSFQPLADAGVEVAFHHQNTSLHHKYGVVDEGTSSDPLVITGSHNWTNSAEFDNDENILIIHDTDVANLFRQEFEARWNQSTVGIVGVAHSSDELNIRAVRSISRHAFELIVDSKAARSGQIGVFNQLGQSLGLQEVDLLPGLQTFQMDLSSTPQGLMWFVIRTQNGMTQVAYFQP